MPDDQHTALTLTPETLSTQFAEAYRALRANVDFSSIDSPVRTIVVTSARPAEGKTVTTINLGIIISQAGPRVLLVDCDFRRPSLDQAMGLVSDRGAPLRGLSDLIVGNATPDEVYVAAPTFPRLGLIAAGTRPPNPGELLGSRRMQAVMGELGRMADVLLVDTPPCLVYADAFVLSQLADGVLYVVRAGPQDKAAQRRIQRRLEQAKARVLGIVFNDAQVDDSSSTYAYYQQRGKRRPR